MRNNNTSQVLNLLVKELQIPVTRQSIDDELLKHPNADSMLAISELLTNWEIPNASYEVTFEELPLVPLPFIAYLKKDKFVLVRSINDKQVVLSNETWKQKEITTDEFKKAFTGNILAAEKDENSGEADYRSKRRNEIINKLHIPFVVTGTIIICLTVLLVTQPNITLLNPPDAFLMLITFSGLIVSILLLIQRIDANNPLIQKLCGSDSNKNCSAILSSKAAKITAELSWSEVGFFYFAGGFLVLLFGGGQKNVIQTLSWLNLISLPYTFYSVYYQWRVARQWCLFCCTVQVILWLQFLSYLPYLSQPIQIPGSRGLALLFAGMLTPVILWVFLKPYLLLSGQVQPLKQQLFKFKYNAGLFQKRLKDEIKYALPNDEDTLLVGDRDAEKVITVISNPYCQPCAKAHQLLDEWVSGREDIKWQTVFYTTKRAEDKTAIVANHLMSLQAQYTELFVKQALNDWYKEKNYAALVKKYPVKGSANNQGKLERQRSWCRTTGTTFTPTIFINGRKLPPPYQPEDIKYLL